jgi:predicted nucleic acid-binding protein
VILDASVAVKWCLPDESDPAATRLLEQYTQGRRELFVPDLFWPEMASALAGAARRGRTDEAGVREAFEFLEALNLEVLSTRSLAQDVCRQALTLNRTTYDLFYALLAQARNDVLITADDRLVRALGHRFPVRSLASLSEW